ncbi:MAG TPA: TetR/AcrR family transcriptional regulator [Spirochaetota bacterium]|nr:TetR/AcrR family transcriptional regulator [Spirochaetota bacterium]
MGRKAHFTNEQFYSAAMSRVAENGPESVTVASIAEAIGAPVGSVYHRFSSREMIMAGLWLSIAESFQKGFLEILNAGDCIAASLYTPQWVRRNPIESKILLLYRREELIGGEWPEQVRERAEGLEQELRSGLNSFVKKQFGRCSEKNIRRTVFALIDVPLASVRRHLENDETPPEYVDELVRETCITMMEVRNENI